jgi:peptide/nickel transport system permease protein
LGIVALFIFFMLRLTDGDPASIIAGENATQDQIDGIRLSLGLDQPLIIQFKTWVIQMATGDFGKSFYFNKPVTELLMAAAWPTVSLTITTIIFTLIVAIPLGVIAAYKRGSWIDRLAMGLSTIGFSVPVFIFGYVLIYFVSIKLGWLPVQGYKPITGGFWPWLRHLILPTITVSMIYIALISRMTRASVVETLGQDYVRTARAKGQVEWRVVVRHALRNAAVPIVTVIGIGVALLIGGVVITETVFNIPGIGRLTVEAVTARDYPTTQAVILLLSCVYVLINLIVDLACFIFDPRIRE